MVCSLPGYSVHGDSPGKSTGVGCHALLQGVVPTKGSNPGLLSSRQILYHLSHLGCPWIEWVAYSFCSRSSRPSNWTGVSCIAGQIDSLPAELTGKPLILEWVAMPFSRETHCQPQTKWGARSSPPDAPFFFFFFLKRDLSWFQYLTFWVIVLHTVNSCSYCFKFTSKEWVQENLGPQQPKLNLFLFLSF